MFCQLDSGAQYSPIKQPPIFTDIGFDDDITNEELFLSAPTDFQITSGLDLTAAIAWDGYDLGATDSNKIDDRGIIDEGAVQERGFAQFNGSLTFFRGITSETTGAYADAFAAFKAATDGSRPQGYLVTRIGVPATTAIAAPQKVNVFKFIADAFMDNTEGEDSVKFMVNFAPQGKLAVNATVVAD